MNSQRSMTQGSIWRPMLSFALPLLLGNLFQQLYNAVDTIIVGRYVGDDALAAVGSSGSIVALLVSFCVGLSAGASVLISQAYGARDEERMKKIVHTTIATALVAGVAMTILGVFAVPVILRAMDTPADVFPLCSGYLRVFFGGMLFSVVYNMCAGILNAVGNSRRSLVYLIIAALSNIVLDLLFVVGFNMGVVGAAIATDISQLIAAVFILRFLLKSKEIYRVRLKDVRFYKGQLSQILRMGLPSGVQNIVISLSNVIVQSTVNGFGKVIMAGYAAYSRIDGFMSLPLMSISMAAATFTGQNVGAQEYGRVKKGAFTSVGMVLIYTVAASALLYVFAPQLVAVFSEGEEVVKQGAEIMRFLYPHYWSIAIFFVLGGTLRGAGKSFQSMLISLASLCLFRMAWIWFVFPLQPTVDMLFWLYPASWVFGLVISLLYVKFGHWLPERLEEPETVNI